jgi:lipoprotein-anchoring transpeptidase ErfK/SrfK
MSRRSVVLVAALVICVSAPLSGAFAQNYPAGSQIYRDQTPGPRGLPPSWLVDDEDQPAGSGPVTQQPLPPPGYPAPGPGASGQNAPALSPPGFGAPPPVADAAPAVPRPPAGIGAPGSAAPQAGAPVTTSALPPEDQPETGEPKKLSPELQRQLVDFQTKEPAGTIIIDTSHTFLYLTLGGGKALRYGIGVGREGFTWSGTERISRMKEWPDWFPPAEMIERQPYLPRMMAGGEGNPLGARALYLGNTLYRIHGTNQPSTIGQFVSSGCIRLLNKDIEDLYSRVQVGTRVVVLPGAKGPDVASRQRPTSVMTIGADGTPQPTNAAAMSSAPLPAAR